MKKMYEYLRKYYLISLLLSMFVFALMLMDMVQNGSMPTITYYYFIRIIFGFIMMSLILFPGVMLIDLLIVKSAKALFSDFRQADRTGKIIIVVVMVMMLLRKVLLLTR